MLSVRESFDNGAGAGVEPLLEHWQELPCERAPPWQQQEPFVAQQVPRGAERAAVPAQQACRLRDLPVQCGHVAADAASTGPDSTLAGRWDWFPQAQAIKGMVCAGTSTLASQTRTLAVILSQNCTGRATGYVSYPIEAAAGRVLPARSLKSTEKPTRLYHFHQTESTIKQANQRISSAVGLVRNSTR